LGDHTKLITYGASSPVSLSWTSTVTEAKSFQTEISARKTSSAEFDADGQLVFGVGLGPYITGVAGGRNSLTLSLGKTSESNHVSERTVSVTLDDPDNGDYFAVRITEDPVYATPVFTTMGGVSKCPGETGTSRRESGVRIVQIIPRCGADKKSICDETTLAPGDSAVFGVVIQNLSPTQDEVYYTLTLKDGNFYDDFEGHGGSGTHLCGVSGQLSGLAVGFTDTNTALTNMQRIPYKRLIEVPFTVDNVYQLCNKYISSI
jgi:hypothetical protein